MAFPSDYFTFLKELPKSFSQIGAMLPSSPLLGRAMVRPIKEADGPLNILEVGPGTGPFTRQILRLMGPEDRFTICEINPRFLDTLKRNLFKNEHYGKHVERVEFFLGAVQQLPEIYPERKFDIIVSSLPFSNFTPEIVDEILTIFKGMTAEDGKVVFCEYIGLRKISAAFSSRRSRARVEGVEKVIKRWCDDVEAHGVVRTELSLLNVPPAVAIQFQYQNH